MCFAGNGERPFFSFAVSYKSTFYQLDRGRKGCKLEIRMSILTVIFEDFTYTLEGDTLVLLAASKGT